MDRVVPGQEWISDSTLDLYLLASAAFEAEQARLAGLVIGPPIEAESFKLAVEAATVRDIARVEAIVRPRPRDVHPDTASLGAAS